MCTATLHEEPGDEATKAEDGEASACDLGGLKEVVLDFPTTRFPSKELA